MNASAVAGLALWALLALLPLSATAGDGHDHGDAPPAPSGPALPRFAASSERFELVGVVHGRQVTLYLDHAADNAPVTDARLEVELGGTRLSMQSHADGEFEATLAQALPPGVIPVTATITTAKATDLLAGELDLHEPAPQEPAPSDQPSAKALAAVTVALAALLGLALWWRTRRPRARTAPLGAASLALLATLWATPPPALAGPGHDHDDAPPAAPGNGPQRLPDGGVFLPKPAQRQIGVRTQVAELRELPRSIELQGQVVMDPNAGGKVQPTLAGRLAAGPRGLPSVGQAVRRGEVLAYVLPTAAPLERATQAAQVAELQAQHGLARKRLARLQELADTVPHKEIEAAQSELEGLGHRVAVLSNGLATREALVAPVTGVIASAHAVAGQVVDARELLFEVIAPGRLRVEALAFDPALAQDVAGAFMPLGQQAIALAFVGASRTLREQALPLVFQARGDGLAALAVGQPVTVVVQTRSTIKGVPVPAAALQRNPANQAIVWVKTGPERYEPRVVQAEPLDGARVAVTAGLRAGERVVTQGATLVNQVR